ncbi:hypothetical protein D9M72_468760 [compost metagenome]
MPSLPPPKPMRPEATDRSVPAMRAELASSVLRVASSSSAAPPFTSAPAPMRTRPPVVVSTFWRSTFATLLLATRTSAPQSRAGVVSTSSSVAGVPLVSYTSRCCGAMIRSPTVLAPVPRALTTLPASTATCPLAARMISGPYSAEPASLRTTMSLAVTFSPTPSGSPLRVPPTSRLPAPKFDNAAESITR